jgi:hypothetical protein
VNSFGAPLSICFSGGAPAESEAWCLELHSGTMLPLLAAVYRQCWSDFFGSTFAHGRSNDKFFTTLIVQTNMTLKCLRL